jgi:hypothetical protein
MHIGVRRDDIEDDAGEVHHPERMFEPFVASAGENKIGCRKLMDMSQPLKRARIYDQPLVAVQSDKDMDRISKFVNVFDRCHRQNPSALLNGEVTNRYPL